MLFFEFTVQEEHCPALKPDDFISSLNANDDMITPTPLSRALPSLRSRFPQPAFRTTTSVLRCLHVDAHHPHGLYWHDLGKYDNVPVYALSFLKEPPKSAYSITNIGLVRGTELNAKTFEQAPEWMQLGLSLLSFHPPLHADSDSLTPVHAILR